MKAKHFLVFTLGIFLVTLIACSKDSDGLDEDFSSKPKTSLRSSNQLEISYEMNTSQNIKPTTGTIQDLCAMDIKILTVPSSTSTVTTTLGPEGQACIRIVDFVQDRYGREIKGGSNKKTTTEYCGGRLVFTDTDGSVTHVETEVDINIFKTIYESYYYTETQKDSAMNVMILEAKNDGAKVTKKGNALTITSVDADGNTETIVYDIKNHVVVASSTVDKEGNLITKTSLGYKCNADGKIVPDFVINYNYKDNMICSDPVFTVEQVQFDNFRVTL